MKRKILWTVVFSLLVMSFANAQSVTEESCSNWIYSQSYSAAWSCDVCWYYNSRFYRNRSYDLWDYFKNINNKEYIISTNSAVSYAQIHNLWATINYTNWNYVGTNNRSLTANWVPQWVWFNVLNHVMFIIKDTSWNQDLATWARNTPIWLAEYNMKYYQIKNGWYNVSTTLAYLSWNETQNVDGSYTLNHQWITSNTPKNIDINNPMFHKECYVMLPAWCWDGVVSNWEQCDYNDTTKTWWWNADPGCNSSCIAVNTTTPWWWGGWWGWGGGGWGYSPSWWWWGGWGSTPTTSWGWGGNQFSDDSKCDYIDPPSIQIWEYLPIWWKLKKDIWTASCWNSTQWKFNPAASKCYFEIKNWDWESVNFTTWCFVDNWSSLADGFLQDQGRTLDFGSNYYWRTNYLVSSNSFSKLWEYKIRLNKIDYQLCNGSSWQNGSYDGTVCEMNFAVTRPYLLQRWTNISTLNNDVLSNFLKINWDPILSPSELKNITVSNYSWGKDVEFILNDFISKYEKLAVKTSNFDSLWLYNLKKVPDKEIYIIDAWGETIDLNTDSSVSNPATLIVKNWSLVVKWNLKWNGMYIVPDWQIYFQPTNCDQKQLVEWIFISKDYDTSRVLNNNLSATNWCKDGRLNVKWNLIWQWIDKLWAKRRSILEDFFNVWISRVNKIYEWSSLLIETNTKLWLNLPPGANELVDKLQIDKK